MRIYQYEPHGTWRRPQNIIFPETRDPKGCHSDLGWEHENFRMEPRPTSLELPPPTGLIWGTQGDPLLSVSFPNDFWSFPRDGTLLHSLRFCELFDFEASLPSINHIPEVPLATH